MPTLRAYSADGGRCHSRPQDSPRLPVGKRRVPFSNSNVAYATHAPSQLNSSVKDLVFAQVDRKNDFDTTPIFHICEVKDITFSRR